MLANSTACRLVRGGLGVVLLFLLGMAAWHGRRLPYADDWNLMPAFTGEQRVDLRWLWSQHNEHRIFLPRLILLALHDMSDLDHRAPILFNILALGGLAAVLLRVIQTERGHVVLADLLIPLSLLHAGQSSFVWGFHVQFVSSTVLSGLALAIMIR